MLRHFFTKLLVRRKTGPEKLIQNLHFHLQETTTRVDTSRKSISGMLRHFSEQYKTDLAERPLFMGDHGKRVLVKELKVCALNIHEIFRRMLEFFSQVVVASNKHILIFRAHFQLLGSTEQYCYLIRMAVALRMLFFGGHYILCILQMLRRFGKNIVCASDL